MRGRCPTGSRCRSASWSGLNFGALCYATLCLTGLAAEPGDLAREKLVPAARFDKSILVELRYATPSNISGKALYRPSATALLREGTARRLRAASLYLEPVAYRLKIWDAYRPPSVQARLKELDQTGEYVADAATEPALHTWGVAVDITLVDRLGRPVGMPTDLDFFGRKAWIGFAGVTPAAKRNLRVLQVAMGRSGFLGLRREWWHFVDMDWKRYGPVTPPLEEMALAGEEPAADKAPPR